MRFAYADPPYPGQAKRWYGNHPDYAGEVDHARLVDRLNDEYPDGWALSTSAAALQYVLGLCPAGVRVAVWHVTNAETPGNRRHQWHLCWEPVIVWGGQRLSSFPVRNVLSCPNASGFGGAMIPGQKPPAFCRWVFGLLGATAEDQLDDLFPGSGAVAREWEAYCRQSWLPALSAPRGRERDRRRLASPDQEMLEQISEPRAAAQESLL